jgi:4-aminobutyrate aminotransferase-like enzyme
LGSCLISPSFTVFSNHPFVGDVRGRGLFQGLELVAHRAGKQPDFLEYATMSGTRQITER